MGIVARSKTVAARILPLICFLTVSLPHHPFSHWLDDAFIVPVGYHSVQHIADIASWILLAVVTAAGVRIAMIHRSRSLRHFAVLAILVLLMYPADHYLIVNNIERVHYPQYAALAFLLGLSLRGEMLIFFLTSFAGFADEFLQYAMNPMKSNYLDFNDIVLNILGAAAGVVLLMGLRKRLAEKDFNREERHVDAKGNAEKFITRLKNSWRSWRPCPPRTVLVRGRLDISTELPRTGRYEAVFAKVFGTAMVAGVIVVLVAGLFGRIVMLLEQPKDRSVFEVVNGKLTFIMSFERHDEFWVKSYFGKVFHVLSVGEGLAAIAVLVIATWCAVSWLRVKLREPIE